LAARIPLPMGIRTGRCSRALPSNQGTTEVGDSFDRHYAGVGNSNKLATLLALLFPVPSLSIARIHNIGVNELTSQCHTGGRSPEETVSIVEEGPPAATWMMLLRTA
jgi:hypothetical protein